jgi:hypothetical protein
MDGTMPMGPTIDASKIPTGEAGFDSVRISPTDEIAPDSDIGAFRTVCDFSHMSFDDPIVFPGQTGRSHLHAFFGNTGTNASSTDESINTTGRSTCRGGIANRSSYWVPAMIDTKDGAPVKPRGANIYYKTGYRLPAEIIKPFPRGLRMIAGDAKSSGPQDGVTSYVCVNGGEELHGAEIQNCPVGAELWMRITFPQCWDGQNVDSVDHKSHMAYPTDQQTCPPTHPVALPELGYNIMYPVTEANAPLRWRLASDMYDASLPGGYSAHGDYWFGWDEPTMKAWVENCDAARKDCHSHLLGDGRMIF